MKYLIWAVVLYFAWRWYLTSKSNAAQTPADSSADSSAGDAGTSTRAAPASEAAGSAPEKMVGCAHCGIHLPLSEALAGADQRHYCCEQHRSLHSVS